MRSGFSQHGRWAGRGSGRGGGARPWLLALLLLGTPAQVCEPASAQALDRAPAIAMRGTPDLPATFAALPYADPNAPKGGHLDLSLLGTFDSLNPFIVKGSAPLIMRNYVIESLMARSLDEPFTLYALLAQSVTSDAERSFVAFALNPAAHFSDGSPVTADDVLFSFTLMRDMGRPNHRLYYGKIARAEAPDTHTVRFTFTEPDPELPLIMGLMPVFKKASIDRDRFEETTLTPLTGSGPYRVGAVDAGASVTLERNPDYWGRTVPFNRGLYNFDRIRFFYFRDANTEFEAFKKGLIDARFETDPGRWETGYDFPAARSGDVVKELIPTGTPKPYSAFVFNTRRPLFADRRVRQALIELFDFEWLDKNFYHGLYRRTASYFEGSVLSSSGVPADARERALLDPYPDAVVPEVLAGTFRPPVSDGSGRDRERLKSALQLLDKAGWMLRQGALVNRETGRPFAFEIMVATREQERLALAYQSQLKRAGIAAQVRYVDAVQFDARRGAYEFDMMPFAWSQSLSPGNEQAFYFGSAAADTPGSRNYMGAKSPAIDAAIAALLAARDEDEYVSAARALDRVLVSGAYGVPLFHTPGQWLARWTRIERPQRASLYGTLPETWWRVPGK
ncbi:extracellular solute-binding protein family 5 [Xanthobacter versatilis]|uniref:Extracellular solute-binding protein family 5 n=1 Tax=Xanthobacter autotrophicus (strain ATCC BAA-1158 / Py2) TaxID=78245 RepID=A7IM48_XANP2|nr:extracellular solute-binding protein family 5 [Xanthobacter autotrophicus Py2]